jgi:D-alanyl-D-alanine carboxypeptidase
MKKVSATGMHPSAAGTRGSSVVAFAKQPVRLALFIVFALLAAAAARAAPFASFVMDARTGQVLHAENAETPLHPASLTKMMTLYVAFHAIQRGEITLDTEVRIPALAASEPPSRLGLREGQVIRLRFLLRAAAVRSANDAATAIGFAIAGSEEAMAARMNAMARAMGMTSTHFINMHGLTEQGHYSTARDMTILGRHLIYDFPQYYNLFSRRTADAGIAEVVNTNRRFLDNYEGADGIKTGFTNAAGYNLVASAQRDGVRIIATVFGGDSTADRNARVADLLDLGFARAPAHAEFVWTAPQVEQVAAAPRPVANTNAGPAARVVRTSGQVQVSLRPMPRPGSSATGASPQLALAAVDPATIDGLVAAALAAPPAPRPAERPAEIILTAAAIDPGSQPLLAPEPEVVNRVSTSGGHHWGITLGSFASRGEAERALIQVAIGEAATLEGGVRRITQARGGFDAKIVGLTRDAADLACRRLQARGALCFTLGTEES